MKNIYLYILPDETVKGNSPHSFTDFYKKSEHGK